MTGMRKFTSKFALLIIGLGCGIFPQLVEAAEIVKTAGVVTGIRDVLVNGERVEIIILDGSFSRLFPARYVPPITSEAAARAAMVQVVAALNSGSGTLPRTVEGCGPGACLLFLPFADHTDPGSARVIRGQTDSATGWTEKGASFNHKGFNTRSTSVSTYLVPVANE